MKSPVLKFLSGIVAIIANSEPCCLITTDISDRMYVELFDGNNPHTLGDFTLEELETNPTLKVEVKFKNFKWEDF